MDSTPPSHLQGLDSQRLLNEIGITLLKMVPDGWQRIDLRCSMAVRLLDLALTVIMKDGSSSNAIPPPDMLNTLTLLFVELRRAAYRPSAGTWFSARSIIDPPGDYSIRYNFDYDPRWNLSIPVDEFRRDLDIFPRDDNHIPDWLRTQLGLTVTNNNKPPGVLYPIR